ncbi:MAG: hypothetical protein KDA78_14775, partial [Planctomycetaceae bacterium]|nr:hypothetical protein [Planctomycetaceae bacterium]
SARKKSKSPDHPGTDEDVRQLIVQMHGETGDSYTLLEGRLKRLGSCASSYHFQVYQQTVFR